MRVAAISYRALTDGLEYGLALCGARAWGLPVVVRRVSGYCVLEGVRCVQ